MPLLFVLVLDMLSSMFTHVLTSKVLVGVSFGGFKSRCNLHYGDDLLVLTTGGLEDLRIVKLIIFLFGGMTGLESNFSKTCLHSVRMGELQDVSAAATLNCMIGLLLVMYLGLTISRRRPRRQDWEGLILKVKKRLSSWKVRHFSLGGRLTLVNSVLSALPTYWMSIFRLTKWVIKELYHIRRDFLWSGPDIKHPRCNWVKWKSICHSRDQGGWEVLNLDNFNHALFG